MHFRRPLSKTSFRSKSAIQKYRPGVSGFKPRLCPGETFNRPSGNQGVSCFRQPNPIANAVLSGGNVSTTTTGTGLVVVDGFRSLIASNEEAIQILAFPVNPNQMRRPWPLLKEKIDSCLRNGHSGNGLESVHEFRSGKRTYHCRSFTLKICGKEGTFSEARVLLFERKENNVAGLSEASDRFGLTQREQETIHLLLQGLTSKEIAERMSISPNTVKAFLRLVMVKMGVGTRSAIVGKVLGPASTFGGNGSARP